MPRERWVGRVYGRLVEDAVSASAVELVEPGPRAGMAGSPERLEAQRAPFCSLTTTAGRSPRRVDERSLPSSSLQLEDDRLAQAVSTVRVLQRTDSSWQPWRPAIRPLYRSRVAPVLFAHGLLGVRANLCDRPRRAPARSGARSPRWRPCWASPSCCSPPSMAAHQKGEPVFIFLLYWVSPQGINSDRWPTIRCRQHVTSGWTAVGAPHSWHRLTKHRQSRRGRWSPVAQPQCLSERHSAASSP